MFMSAAMRPAGKVGWLRSTTPSRAGPAPRPSTATKRSERSRARARREARAIEHERRDAGRVVDWRRCRSRRRLRGRPDAEVVVVRGEDDGLAGLRRVGPAEQAEHVLALDPCEGPFVNARRIFTRRAASGRKSRFSAAAGARRGPRPRAPRASSPRRSVTHIFARRRGSPVRGQLEHLVPERRRHHLPRVPGRVRRVDEEHAGGALLRGLQVLVVPAAVPEARLAREELRVVLGVVVHDDHDLPADVDVLVVVPLVLGRDDAVADEDDVRRRQRDLRLLRRPARRRGRRGSANVSGPFAVVACDARGHLGFDRRRAGPSGSTTPRRRPSRRARGRALRSRRRCTSSRARRRGSRARALRGGRPRDSGWAPQIDVAVMRAAPRCSSG